MKNLVSRLSGEEETSSKDIFEEALDLLREVGVHVSQWLPGWQLLALEAVNWAAKQVDESFYDLKPEMADRLAENPEFRSGWTADRTFAAYHPDVGTVHVHDPMGQIKSQQGWDVEWSGVRRQHLSFQAVADARLRKALAILTRPGRTWDWEDSKRRLANLTVGPAGSLP